MLEKFKGYKTIAFNIAAAVAAILAGPEVVDAINAAGVSTDTAISAIVAAVAAVNVLLRAVTTTPIFNKE